jgi:hypothetical protein
MTMPTIATQASTDAGSIIRLDRDEHRIVHAHAVAAPSPPRTAAIGHMMQFDPPAWRYTSAK